MAHPLYQRRLSRPDSSRSIVAEDERPDWAWALLGWESVRPDHHVIYVVTFCFGCLYSQLDAGPSTFIEEPPSTRFSRRSTLIAIHASFVGQVVVRGANHLVECEK